MIETHFTDIRFPQIAMTHIPNLQWSTGAAGVRVAVATRAAVELDGWQLVRLVGRGRLTRVYQARPAGSPAEWPSDYAVKVLRPHFENDTQATELICREACVGRRVSHPHLIPILSASVTEPPYYIVMPHLEGVTLRVLLDRPQPLALPHALWIVRQVADALDALHADGWLHADVKPSNVFCSRSGHVTLTDLGLARPIDQGGSIAERPLMGTYAYAAPELFTSTTAADQRSDLYSLGVTLYEMLAGRLPFCETDPAALAAAHLQRAAPDLRKLVPQVPQSVVRLLRRLLAKEPLRRPRSARELTRELVALEIETFEERATV